jgi:hypothetical protein
MLSFAKFCFLRPSRRVSIESGCQGHFGLVPNLRGSAGPWSGSLPVGLTRRRDHRFRVTKSSRITFATCPSNAMVSLLSSMPSTLPSPNMG